MARPSPEPVFAGITGQQPLSDTELAIAERCRAWAVGEVERRYDYLLDNDLPPEIWMPQAGWNCSRLIYEAYRKLARGEQLSLLRLYARQFTGYALYALGDGGRRPFPAADDVAAIEETLRRRSDVPDPCVVRYERLTASLPKDCHLSAPRRFGEVGWLVDERLVNYDIVAYQERVALLHHAGILDGLRRRHRDAGNALKVLEIGAGYGGLAYFLSERLPATRYIVVDIPESLLYSSIYLSVLRPDLRQGYGADEVDLPGGGFTFVANYEFPRLLERLPSVDLVINTLSMSEMTGEQVRTYAEGVARLLRNGGLFFEQNQDNRHAGMTNAADLLTPYFTNCRTLATLLDPLTPEQGTAHVWTT